MADIKFFDCCLNLTHAAFDKDRDEVLLRAAEAGLVGALVCAANLKDSQSLPKLLTKYNQSSDRAKQNLSATAFPRLYGMAGVHPHEAKTWQDGHVDALRKLAELPDCVAIGETGLDYARDFSPRPLQREVFASQLELAAALQLPVFLHQRDAHADFMEILTAYTDRLPGYVVHCFTGQEAELEDYLSMDASYIGITGWICDERRGLHLRDLTARIPAERLLLETDAPYLVPRSLKKRSARNEPANLPHITAVVAEARGTSVGQLAEQTLQNSMRFIQLGGKLEA